MGGRLTDLTFDQWLSHVFDHPVDSSRQEWYWQPDTDWWEGAPAVTVQFLTRLFEHAQQLLQPYSDAQLNQGLWYIASNACSNHMFALMDVDVPWPARQRCLRSMHDLFAQCFARRCTPHLGHLPETEPGASPLNLVCYMWWDILPIGGRPEDPNGADLNLEILKVMESTLQLDSVACQESALHGLGHWHFHAPQQVEEIINTYLKRQNDLREELRLYAMSARRGCVL